MIYLIKLSGLLIASILLSSQLETACGDVRETMYNSVFRFHSLEMSPAYVVDVLQRLDRAETGFRLDDPRRMQVFFWKVAAEDSESKCTLEYDEKMRARLEQDKSLAEQEGLRTRSSKKYFNLEYFVEDLRSSRFTYCQNRVGNSFIRALSEASARNGGGLIMLTARLSPSNMDVNKLGKRIGQLISRNLDEKSFTQLTQWLDDTDYVRENYELFSPCAGVMKVVQKYEGYYGLVTLPGYYWRCRLQLREWLNRILVCKFIDQSREVFERAARYIRDKDRPENAMIDSPQRAIINGDRYNSIFKLRKYEKLSASYVTVALFLLESYRWGLPAKDQRRSEVSYWINAAKQDDSKCNIESDDDLRSQLEQQRSGAERVAQVIYGNEVFNLESYVEHVRSEQLLYCESKFGLPFLKELTELNKSNYIDICLLAQGYRHAETIDAEELGKRVIKLAIETSGLASNRSVDPGSIRDHYKRHSPCEGLLEIAGRYAGYYSLMTAPGNYQKVRPVMRNWIDKITVCKFIDESDQVFQAAAEYLQTL